jgi:hypothetical protein
MEHEHVIRIMDDHEIRRSNNEVGRLGVRAYQLQTMQIRQKWGVSLPH